jgi:hypothetical protein
MLYAGLHQVTGFDPNHELKNVYNKVTTILAKRGLMESQILTFYFQDK